jgi:hypothetical protein
MKAVPDELARHSESLSELLAKHRELNEFYGASFKTALSFAAILTQKGCAKTFANLRGVRPGPLLKRETLPAFAAAHPTDGKQTTSGSS